MSRLSMDLKVMPKSHKGHKYILCIIDEVTNYLITVPMFQAKSEEVGEAILEHVITKHCIPDYIIMDQETYNTFNSPNLGYYSPFELTFGRKLKVLLNTETNPKVSTNFKEYYDLLNKRIKYLEDILFNFKFR